jgi:hypothetical protein
MEDLDFTGSDLSNYMPEAGNFFRMSTEGSVIRVIETDKFIMKIHDQSNLLEYIIKENVYMDVDDVWAGKKLLTAAYPNRKFYVLAQGIDFFTLTKEARKVTSTADYSDNTLAIAFFASNPSIFLLGKMYTKINKPIVPTNVFYNLDEAREWLFEQMKK